MPDLLAPTFTHSAIGPIKNAALFTGDDSQKAAAFRILPELVISLPVRMIAKFDHTSSATTVYR
jgi:hypothetical protein